MICTYSANTWEAAEEAVLNVFLHASAYLKVLKDKQLGMFQFRTVSGCSARGNLGSEMGKLLVNGSLSATPLSQSAGGPSPHLIYGSAHTAFCDAAPCCAQDAKGVCLA